MSGHVSSTATAFAQIWTQICGELFLKWGAHVSGLQILQEDWIQIWPASSCQKALSVVRISTKVVNSNKLQSHRSSWSGDQSLFSCPKICSCCCGEGSHRCCEQKLLVNAQNFYCSVCVHYAGADRKYILLRTKEKTCIFEFWLSWRKICYILKT